MKQYPLYHPKHWVDQEGVGPLGAILVTLFSLFVAQSLVAGLALGIYIQVTGADPDTVFNTLTDSSAAQFILSVLAYGSSVGFIYWFMRRRGMTLAKIGLQRWPQLKDLGYAAIFFMGYMVALAFIMQIIQNYIPAINTNQEQQIGFENAQGFLPLFFVFLSLVFLPPIVEEIMIRGFLYTGLRQKWNRIVAALVASLIFGFAHLQLFQGAPPLYVAAIDTFFLSVVLIALREKTNSLWAGMMVHAFKNGIAFLVLFVFKTS